MNIDNTTIVLVPVDDIVIGHTFKNIRTTFDDTTLQQLATDIMDDGLMQPLLVMASEDENGDAVVELVAGERRLRAIQYARKAIDASAFEEGVPCLMYVGDLREAKFVNALENFDREDIDDVSTSRWLWDRVSDGMTQTELAERLHRSAPWVSQRVTFHERASDDLKQAVLDQLLPFSAACILAAKFSKDEQNKLVEKARKFGEKITVEKAERANDKDRVARPSKKRLEDRLQQAEGGKTPFHNGFAFALRYTLGLSSEQDVDDLLKAASDGKLEE